ncbi:HlyD family secretion protein [Tahibacter amnicola]|uniref:Efflux RND transporter periplasmic adaptor subunit n=1 Tax=Tahibacter amnicola TaxID=2976241 RepID=A0ABY6B8Q4_9GAMM|nr:HlyD family efflux transporter periplasmic adaptor subunit [Tahibacter amnicola]UXI66054.1 efflux RND transporter periplasmic adaptor subunit [Tahibacter amnicola]
MKRSWIWPLIAVFAVAALSFVVFVVLRPPRLPQGFQYGSGHIEGTQVRLAAEVGGRVLEHSLTEGSRVQRGQRLVVIDPELGRDIVRASQGELDALRNSRAAIDAQIATWSHHAETARQQVDRVRKLVETKVASQLNLDQASDAARQAEGQLGQLRSQRQAIDAQIASAEARSSTALTQLARTEVSAPQDATVLVRAAQTGEVVQPGQSLAILVDLTQLKLKVYVPSDRLGAIRLEQPVKVRVDSYPERYFDARVARVDDYAQFTPRDIHLPQERTQMVYGVELALNNPDGVLKPGMPADAWIRIDDKAPWPIQLPVPRE